jgi:ribosomal protein S18 acetylase RimI-like enzyme
VGPVREATEVSAVAPDPESALRRERREVVITSGSGWRDDRRALAALLYVGYARKAEALHVDRDEALAILAEALDLDRCLIAASGRLPVGVVGLVEGRARALDFPFVLVRRHFGLVRAVAYSLPLSIRRWSRPAAGELMFEALAVSPEDRNCGIGTRLVEHVERYAREKGYRSVGLEVTDSNSTAIRLYSRLGYTIVKTRRYPFVASRAGFGGNHYMRKPIEANPCPKRAAP